MKNPILIVVGAIFLVAVAIQAYPLFVTSEITKPDSLDNLISRDLPGWSVEDLPLAETEELRNVVESRLRFDDAISRIYQQGNTQVILYVAYWSPGKEPIRLVQNHTPDRCWVSNGWICLDEEYAVSKTLPTSGTALKPAEWRIFEHGNNNTVQHVLFWHIAGDDVVIYRRQEVMDRTAALKDIFRFGLNQRREQFFVRLSSNMPIEQIWDDPGVQQIIRDLADLCLQTEEAASDVTLELTAR